MGRLDAADGAGAGAHHQRFGGRAFAAVADALEDVAVGDAGGGEEDVLAGAEVVGCEDLVEVVAGVDRGAPLLVVARPEPSQELAAHRLQRRRREHALGGAADPPEEVDRGALGDRQERRRDVAVGDQADAGAGLADRADLLLVAGPVEDDDDHVADRAAAALGDQLAGLHQRPVEVEQVGDVFAARELFHVDAGAGVEHRAALGERDHRQGARHPEGAEARPLQRVDRDVDLRRAAVADVLAVEEHRGFVLLPLADDDDAVHRDRVEDVAHRVHGGPVGGELVAAADPAGGREGGRLGDADELQREVAIRLCRARRRHRPGTL